MVKASRDDVLLSSAKSLVLLQLLSRLITFSLNRALLTFTSPHVFGTAAIQFDLIGSTLLFLSREPIRSALLRTPPQDRQLHQNLSLLPLPLFLTLAALIVPLYIHSADPTTTAQPYFFPSLALHLLAYLLELLSEPYHIRLQADLDLTVRVRAEGTAVIFKAIGTLSSVYLLGEHTALLAFGLGQLAYGTTVLGTFIRTFGWRAAGGMWVPRKVQGRWFEGESKALARAMALQSVVKHFLTEGDRMIVSRVSPLEDQGGYAIATNYGTSSFALQHRIELNPPLDGWFNRIPSGEDHLPTP